MKRELKIILITSFFLLFLTGFAFGNSDRKDFQENADKFVESYEKYSSSDDLLTQDINLKMCVISLARMVKIYENSSDQDTLNEYLDDRIYADEVQTVLDYNIEDNMEHKLEGALIEYLLRDDNWLDNMNDSYSEKSENQSAEETDTGTEDLEVIELAAEFTADSCVCTGKVKNKGNRTYYFVKVKVRYKDSNAEVLDTNTGYAAGEEGLEPGEASSFRISVPYDERIGKVSASVYDYSTD